MGCSTADVASAVRAMAAVVVAHRDELVDLDRVIGDGDHGENLKRGFDFVVSALDTSEVDSPAAVLKLVAKTLISKVGGASGPLLGTAFLRAASGLEEVDGASVAAALRAALDGVVARGKAEVGDKTMVDALVPFSAELSRAVEGGVRLADAWAAAARAATQAAASTADLLPRMGRARPHAEKSLGTPDPGAYSLALIATAIGGLLADTADERN